MRSAWLALVVVFACHHDAAPNAPIDPPSQPPLPPASGTPVGFLLDDASEMHLTDDQLGKLRDIDTSLAAELEVIDSQVRQANRPADPDPSQQQPRRGGGRHGGMGGMGGGGMGGGGMGGGGGGGGGRGGGGHHRGSGAGSGSPANAANVGKLTEERANDVRDALHRVFDLLDPNQQETAKKVLAAHDVDLDTGATVAAPTPPTAAPTPAPAPIPPPPPATASSTTNAPPPVFIKPPPKEPQQGSDERDPDPEP